jgi:hypothetical protein
VDLTKLSVPSTAVLVKPRANEDMVALCCIALLSRSVPLSGGRPSSVLWCWLIMLCKTAMDSAPGWTWGYRCDSCVYVHAARGTIAWPKAQFF